MQTKYDPSWGSVVDASCLLNFDKRLGGVYNDAYVLYDCTSEGKARIQSFIEEIDALFPCLQASLEYSSTGKAVVRDSLISLKALAIEILYLPNDPDCDNSNPNVRIDATATVNGSKSKFQRMSTIMNYLGVMVDAPGNLTCHETGRGISPWTITFEEGSTKDYLNSIKDGQLAHYMIEYYYKNIHPSAYREYAIPKSSKNGNTGYADIVNPGTMEIFEIKSDGGQSEGAIELARYINKANIYCNGTWNGGTGFVMPSLLWPRNPKLKIKASTVAPGIIIYTFENNNNPERTPVFQPLPQNYIEIIKSLTKLMATATSVIMAERLVRDKLKSFPPNVLRNIALGAAAGTVVGLAASFTGVGTAAGITAVVASVIIADIALEQLKNTEYEGS